MDVLYKTVNRLILNLLFFNLFTKSNSRAQSEPFVTAYSSLLKRYLLTKTYLLFALIKKCSVTTESVLF